MTKQPWWWLTIWAVDIAILVGLFLYGVLPSTFIAAVVVLFGVPEFIGARVSKDSYAPLTQVIRHHLPRWVIFPVIGAAAVWGAWIWRDRPHHVLIWVIIGAASFWGQDHFDPTFDQAGE